MTKKKAGSKGRSGDQSPEYGAFEKLARAVIQVPKEEVDKLEKQRRKKKKKSRAKRSK